MKKKKWNHKKKGGEKSVLFCFPFSGFYDTLNILNHWIDERKSNIFINLLPIFWNTTYQLSQIGKVNCYEPVFFLFFF